MLPVVGVRTVMWANCGVMAQKKVDLFFAALQASRKRPFVQVVQQVTYLKPHLLEQLDPLLEIFESRQAATLCYGCGV